MKPARKPDGKKPMKRRVSAGGASPSPFSKGRRKPGKFIVASVGCGGSPTIVQAEPASTHWPVRSDKGEGKAKRSPVTKSLGRGK